MTQTELGEKCRTSLNGQSNFERDKNLPGGAYLLALNDLGFDVNYILTGKPGAMNDAEAALLLAYRQTSAAQREKVMEVLR